ncbi:Helix-turn-helix [Afipia felis]|uniref:Helix-turn-helix n=2 Tax=Afipia felis TaxID=1035 RepID=A0A090MR71_AFIFE|nr:Helix-turn-helix [Afipia felis]
MASSNEDKRMTDLAVRLEALRKAEDIPTAAAFAAAIGITPSRLSNFMNASPLSIDVAHKLVARFRVSLDWLYYGHEDALPVELRRRIRRHMPPGTATSERRAKTA